MATPNLLTITSAIPGLLASAQMALGDNTVYTVPSSKAARVDSFTLCNITLFSVTVSISVIPSGGTLDGTHKVAAGYSLAANDTVVFDELEGTWLGEGSVISVNAGTASAVDVTVSGLVFA